MLKGQQMLALFYWGRGIYMEIAVLSLNVNQFGRRCEERKDNVNLNNHILNKVKATQGYLEDIFNHNNNGVAILHEVLFERKDFTKTRAYTTFCKHWRDEGYSIKETDILEKGKRNHAAFRTLAITKNNRVKCNVNGFSIDSTGMLWARWIELEYQDYSIL